MCSFLTSDVSDPVDISTDEGRARLMSELQVDAGVWDQLGSEAAKMGCAARYGEFLVRLSEKHVPWIFRHDKKTWARLEATVCIDQEDEAARMKISPRPTGSACAVDSAMVLVNVLQVGRIQCDMIPLQRLLSLPVVALATRYITSQPWTQLTQPAIDELRDILLRSICDVVLTRHTTEEYLPFGAVLSSMLQDLPQVSWKEIRGLVCCGNVRAVSTQVHTMSCIVIEWKPGFTRLEQQVARYFNAQKRPGPEDHCRAVEPCQNPVKRWIHVVLNTLPPRLVVQLWSTKIGAVESRAQNILDDLNVVYRAITKIRACKYRVIAVVYYLRANHFTIRWRLERTGMIWEIDGNTVTKVVDWWQGYEGRKDGKRDWKTQPFPIIDTIVFQRV